MQEFTGRVAVVTGAASGIGRSLALRCAQEGMKVVVADINAQALAQTESELKRAGTAVLAVQTDVSKASDVEVLAERTLNTFGAVHVLFNNAGVGRLTRIWEAPLAEWEWVLGVNLWGVIHGIHTFVPVMLKQEEEAHIVSRGADGSDAEDDGNGSFHINWGPSGRSFPGNRRQATGLTVALAPVLLGKTIHLTQSMLAPPLCWASASRLTLASTGCAQDIHCP